MGDPSVKYHNMTMWTQRALKPMLSVKQNGRTQLLCLFNDRYKR